MNMKINYPSKNATPYFEIRMFWLVGANRVETQYEIPTNEFPNSTDKLKNLLIALESIRMTEPSEYLKNIYYLAFFDKKLIDNFDAEDVDERFSENAGEFLLDDMASIDYLLPYKYHNTSLLDFRLNIWWLMSNAINPDKIHIEAPDCFDSGLVCLQEWGVEFSDGVDTYGIDIIFSEGDKIKIHEPTQYVEEMANI